MQNKKLKPVWRLNVNGVVPLDLGSEVIYNGDDYTLPTLDMEDPGTWTDDVDKTLCIYAYETTRVREAKRKT